MQLSIISAGPGDERFLTAEARRRIDNADMVLGSERLVRLYGGYKAATAAEVERYVRTYPDRKTAVIVSGDSGFFSLAKSLKKLFPQAEVLPGISSAAYFSAALGVSHEDWTYVSLHGRKAAPAVICSLYKKVFFLTDRQNTPKSICSRLTEFGLGKLKVSVGEELSLENERIRTHTAEEWTKLSASPLCVMLVQNPAAKPPSSIPDSEFIRSSSPMTKQHVRTAAVSMLDITPDSTVWDIGAGCGSVSVEAALRCPRGRVLSVEISPERTELIRQNSRRFCADNIEPITADAVSAIPSMPDPDCVFIGGSSSQTEEILKAVFGRFPKTVVMTMVSLDTVSKVLALADSGQIPSPKICQLSAANVKTAGSHRLLSAENPVFIFSWRDLR